MEKIPCIFMLAISINCHAGFSSTRIAAGWVSEPVERGINVLEDKSAFIFNLDQEFNQQWFAGLDGYMAGNNNASGSEEALSFYLGRAFSVSNNNELTVSLQRRIYADDILFNWDYSEIRLDYDFAESANIALSYADEFFDNNTEAITLGGGWSPRLVNNSYMKFLLHVTEFPQLDIDAFIFSSLGIGYIKSRFNIEFDYNVLSGDLPQRMRGMLNDDHFTLTIKFLIW